MADIIDTARVHQVEWYAAGAGIAKCGPYRTQAEAWRAMRYTDEIRHRTRLDHPPDTRVWPEEVPHGEQTWQPMSTAPRDGTQVLLTRCGKVVVAAWSLKYGRWGTPLHLYGKEDLTAWMPLPPPCEEVTP